MKIILAVLLALIFCGCRNENGESLFVRCKVVKGHEYVIYDNGRGCAIIHSESCSCKAK